MIYTIHKGNHRSWPIIFGLLIHPWMERDVVFDETSEYDLEGTEDDDDVNKLFGFGYINGGHHEDSARFGWNYNKQTGRRRLFAYCYVNGMRIIQEICEVLPHKRFRLLISIYQNNRYVFMVHDGNENWHQVGISEVAFTHNKEFKYKLGCFFGGNNPSPHDIKIELKRK